VAALRPDIVYGQSQGFPLDHERADDPAWTARLRAISERVVTTATLRRRYLAAPGHVDRERGAARAGPSPPCPGQHPGRHRVE